MKIGRLAIVSLCFVFFLSGCITISQYQFSFDFTTGKVIRKYHDLTSRKEPGEKDYSVENDWKSLKELIENPDSEFDASVVQDISKELFQEDKVLSARKIQKVVCPKCFPNKAAILSYLHEKEWRFELINDEVFLFLPGGKKIISTNGRKVKTGKNALIIWPAATTKYEYVVSEPYSGGKSLLPYYLKDKPAAKKKQSD
jgi:hypothetical protein